MTRLGVNFESTERGAGVVRDLWERGHKNLALKVPRQCPPVLLVEAHLREGKALASEEGKEIGSKWTLL
jgi:hypothetical protein